MMSAPHNHINCQEREKSNTARVHFKPQAFKKPNNRTTRAPFVLYVSSGHTVSNSKASGKTRKDNMKYGYLGD